MSYRKHELHAYTIVDVSPVIISREVQPIPIVNVKCVITSLIQRNIFVSIVVWLCFLPNQSLLRLSVVSKLFAFEGQLQRYQVLRFTRHHSFHCLSNICGINRWNCFKCQSANYSIEVCPKYCYHLYVTAHPSKSNVPLFVHWCLLLINRTPALSGQFIVKRSGLLVWWRSLSSPPGWYFLCPRCQKPSRSRRKASAVEI